MSAYLYVQNLQEFDAVQSVLHSNDTLYIDIETYGIHGNSALDPLHNSIRLVTICGLSGPAVICDLLRDPTLAVSLRDSLVGKTLVGHNLLFDLQVLRRYQIAESQNVRDTMIASQVLTAGILDLSHSLGACVDRFLQKTISKELGSSNWTADVLSISQLQYAAVDVTVLRELDAYLNQALNERGLTNTYRLECYLLHSIVSMTLRGVAVDTIHWRERAAKAKAEMDDIDLRLQSLFPRPPEKKLKTVRHRISTGMPYASDIRANELIAAENASRRWNWGSWQQVLAAFRLLGFDMQNTSYETVTRFRGVHPAFDLFLRFRDVQKEATTFGAAWLKHVREDGRVHPSWWQLGARSGRMSCTDPNLQQLPRGACRKGIVAGLGCVFVRADYSQIEARIAAKVSGDQVMLALFRDPAGDIHSYAASKVLGKPQSEVTPEDRQTGKSLVFGLLFGMSAASLRVYCRVNYGVNLTEEQSVLFRKRFFQTFPGLARWHSKVRNMCDAKSEFRTLLGRRRLVQSTDVNTFGLGVNHPVQGSAGDMLKMAVVRMWETREQHPNAAVVMLVHDEIVVECPEDEAVAVSGWLKGCMLEVGNRMIDPVPVEASIKIGKTWGG